MTSIKSPEPIRTDSRPLYTQAIDSLRELLLRGEYHVGDRLPKESTLARQLGISRSTLRVALGYLETCGLISRRPSVGTFVAASIPYSTEGSYFTSLDRFETLLQIADRTDMNLRVIYRDVGKVRSSGEIAATLGVPEGEEVNRIQIVESIDEKPAAYLDTYLTNDVVDDHSLANYQEDAITFLSSFSEFAPSHTRSEIWAKNATADIADKLQLREGQAVLYLQETFHTQQGNCVALSYNYFVSDIFRFYIIRRLAH